MKWRMREEKRGKTGLEIHQTLGPAQRDLIALLPIKDAIR
jgi:hypothetical protein